MSIRYTLCSEGPSDRVLLHHIDWALAKITHYPFSGEWADPAIFSNQAKDVATRAAQAVALYPCDLLFVHRDADNDGYEIRKEEVQRGLQAAGIAIANVAIIPVRMTEAWLLFDEKAIRRASGRPRGTQDLPLPEVRNLERQLDPKRTFLECMSRACGHSGRKLENFKRKLPALRHRVAELTEDFSPLMNVPSFRTFYSDLCDAIDAVGLR